MRIVEISNKARVYIIFLNSVFICMGKSFYNIIFLTNQIVKITVSILFFYQQN